MAGIIKSKLEGMDEGTLSALKDLVAIVMSDPAITKATPKLGADKNPIFVEDAETGESVQQMDYRVDTRTLEGFIELMTEQKRLSKAVDESLAEADKAAQKAIAEARGAEIAKEADVGDTITFEMGSGKGKKTFTRVVEKKGEKTYTVTFTDDYLCTTSATAPTGKKYIKFANVISVTKAVKAETVAA